MTITENTRELPSKRALLIGNNDYDVAKLYCCKNDAEDVGNELKKIGFKIMIDYNLTYIKMTDLIKDFINQINENDFIIFFYSGHGAEWQGQNYLIPIDNKCLVERSDRHEQHAVIIQNILKSMYIKKPSIIIFLLDCCRNPIEISQSLSIKSNPLNIMTIDSPIDTYIVFACGPSQAAFSNSSDNRHSLFTYHLLKYITEPNLKINEMMCRICEGVYKDSNGQIYTHRSSSLRTSDIYFKSTINRMLKISKSKIDSEQIIDIFSSSDNLCHINIDQIFSLIIKGLIQILELETNKYQKEILDNLLQNGRQSLIAYQDKISNNIYTNIMNETDHSLIKILKIYFEQKWKLEYGYSNEYFLLFLKQYQNNDIYEYILTRTCEYGNKYMKNFPILSIVLQLLFEGIDNQCLNETNIFENLWLTITNDGLISIKTYSEYIIEDLMNELINKKQEILFQILKDYYRLELFQLLNESQISNKYNLYDVILDNVAEFGWINGLKTIEKKILPKKFKILLKNFENSKNQSIETKSNFLNTIKKIDNVKLEDGVYRDVTEHDRGIMIHPNGEQYIGEFSDGKRNGYGFSISINDDQYLGFFQDDKKYGFGKLVCTNGEIYIGDWIDDKRNGHGIYKWPNNDEYVGDFRNNMKHGNGTFTNANGEKYMGKWMNDEKCKEYSQNDKNQDDEILILSTNKKCKRDRINNKTQKLCCLIS